ncbi:acyl-CoA dehydrogenase family protein [Geomicrobium sp. JSM 1781026]|uniref:acyl-CoA dehydrogenase family protein n=1 Tax=Geomicrobium sp. JSM 1781026 TaxID=3344580 RepID=UPI0035C23DF0
MLEQWLKKTLKPLVQDIDMEGLYPDQILRGLGEHGCFSSQDRSYLETVQQEVETVKVVSKFCMTTGFIAWCHLALLTYVRHTSNEALKQQFLPGLERGDILGGTGLSNPMKHFAGLEPLHLSAKPVGENYEVSGTLPSVSNLGPNHWFGAVARVEGEDRNIMIFVNCSSENIRLKEKKDYLGINGSATYAVRFSEQVIRAEHILAEDADAFVATIRPYFLVYQIPLGFGVMEAAIAAVKSANSKQNGCNEYLSEQPDTISALLKEQEATLSNQFANKDELYWEALLPIRKASAEGAILAAHMTMLHVGGPAYTKKSHPARRLREAYFLVNLTPTIRHLEKMMDNTETRVAK